MAAPYVTVRINVSRNELKKPGWAKSLPAANVWSSALALVDPTDAVYQYMKSGVPPGMWKEPNTGVLMLKPQTIDEDEVEATANDANHLTSAGLDYGYWDDGAGNTSPIAVALSRSSERAAVASRHITSKPSTAGYNLMDLMVDIAISALLVQIDSDHEILMKTKNPLYMNEGFTIHVEPHGVSTDRKSEFLTVIFGRFYAMRFRMNGVLEFYEDVGFWRTGAQKGQAFDDAVWMLRERFNFAHAGIEHSRPFMISVIPWGERFITIMLSQEAISGIGTLGIGSFLNRAETAFLVDTDKYDRELRYAANQKMFEITKADPVYFAFDPSTRMAIDVSRIRYPDEVNFKLNPQGTIYPREQNPTISLIGHSGHRLNPFETGTQLNVGATESELAEPYDNTTHKFFVADITVRSNTGMVYTPEIWQMDMSIPETVEAPTRTPVDASTWWSNLRFRLSGGLEAGTFEGMFRKPDSEWQNLFKLGVPIEVKAKTADYDAGAGKGKDVPVFEGYIRERNPNPDGSIAADSHTLLNSDEVFAVDLWDRLEYTMIGSEVSIDGRSVADLVKSLVKKAGFTDSDFHSDDSDLADLKISSDKDANSPRKFSESTTIAQAIREIGAEFGIQHRTPLRVRRHWDGTAMKWKIYFPTMYKRHNTVVSKHFYLDHTLIPTHAGSTRGDLKRWNPSADYGTDQHYLITSMPEPTILNPEFNALFCEVAVKVDDGSSLLSYAITPDPKVLDSAAGDWLFEGAWRDKYLSGAQLTARTIEELQVKARHYYNQNYTGLVRQQWVGEWQPGIQPDDLVILVGRSPTAVSYTSPEGSTINISKGDGVSYGVYRIHTIDVEMRYDWASTSWEWHGSYVGYYVGMTGSAFTWPMFTAPGKLPSMPYSS